jgi:bifunctional UDP-N-acetylglucosamine pyrophosphorylase/glucosamine-1-phosphate N-acetyltransferase
MTDKKPYMVSHKKRQYSFSRKALIENREFNAGVYAFKGSQLKEFLKALKCDNVQGEMYLTDLIYLFNRANLLVGASSAGQEEAVLGFNDKTVLHKMESFARRKVFKTLRNVITLQNKDNFFIADEVVGQILEMDRKGTADIFIGEGAHLGPGVKLSPGVCIEKYARLMGRVHLGKGVRVGASVTMDTRANQTIRIGDNTEILQSNIIKGNVTIGRDCRIETTVRLTGSDACPMKVGNRVTIKGTTYMYGCEIEDNVFIRNCYMFQKIIRYKKDKKGNPVRVCHIFTEPMGKECVEDC